MSDIMDDRNVQAAAMVGGAVAATTLVAPATTGAVIGMAGSSGIASAALGAKIAIAALASPVAPIVRGDCFFFGNMLARWIAG